MSLSLLMNTLEAPSLSQATRSDVSDWIGDPAIKAEAAVEAMPNAEKVLADHHQLTNRMFDLTADVYEYPRGHAFPPTEDVFIMRPLRLLNSRLLSPLLKSYGGFTYDSIDVTMSISDPKGIAGGLHLGWYPYRPFITHSDDQFAMEDEHQFYFKTRRMALQQLLMGPTTEAVFYGLSRDMKFTIPWQFNTTHLNRDIFVGDTTMTTIGEPILFVAPFASTFVSSITLPPVLRVFVRFNNLRFLGPDYNDVFAPQMDAAAAAIAIDTAATVGAEVLSAFIPAHEPETEAMWADGTFENPAAVQLSYAGDTTSMGPPGVTPTFSSYFEAGRKHLVSDFLRRPQYLATISSGVDEHVFWGDPIHPIVEPPSDSPITTWFNFFGMHSGYWRGTLVYDFVIAGHPLVEVAYKINLTYPQIDGYAASSNSFSEAGVIEGIAKGVTRIRVPMPWMSPSEVLPMTHDNPRPQLVPSMLVWQANVVSTMLDTLPTIPINVYLSAEEDFMFYWPTPPGLYKLSQPVTAQIGIDVEPIVFQTRAKAQQPLSSFSHPIKYVEDYFRYWCRSLPYDKVDLNDEPIPDPTRAWMPSYGTFDSAGWTPDVNNSWYICQDYISLFSSLFLFYRGSIGIKAICVPTSDPEIPYKYMSLRHYDLDRIPVHNPFTSSPLISPEEANFGIGSAITPSDKQPVLEFTIPYASTLAWDFVRFSIDSPSRSWYASSTFERISSNLSLISQNGDLTDALFRKAGPDYQLSVETLPPSPYLWRRRGFDWS